MTNIYYSARILLMTNVLMYNCYHFQDKLTYTHLGTAEEQKLFYLNPDSGVISLGSSLQTTTKNQFVVR